MDTDDSFFNNSEIDFAVSSSDDQEEHSNEIKLVIFEKELFEDGELIGYIKLCNREGLRKGAISLMFETTQKWKTPKLENTIKKNSEIEEIRAKKSLFMKLKRKVSNRKIAKRLSMSRNTVNDYVRKIKESGKKISELLDLGEDELDSIFSHNESIEDARYTELIKFSQKY